MKFRTDFVTNSSSSSFIIATKDDAEMEIMAAEAIENNPFEHPWERNANNKEYQEKAKKVLIKTIKEAKKTREEIIDLLKEEARMMAIFDLCRSIDFKKRSEYIQTDEYKEKEKAYIEEKIKKEVEMLGNHTNFYYPNFSDNDGAIGSYLEHEVAPEIDGVIKVFNNH